MQGEDWFKTNPVGTGPFKFDSYEPRQKWCSLPIPSTSAAPPY